MIDNYYEVSEEAICLYLQHHQVVLFPVRDRGVQNLSLTEIFLSVAPPQEGS